MKMGIEQNGSGGNGKGKVSNESRKGKRRSKKINPVQKLYETCKEVFADCGPGIVPSPEKVEKLAAILDGITQADVGIRPNLPFFSSLCAPIITYIQLYECDKFSIGLFCLPPTSVIPLHNHPGMTVFSKLLFGSMHIRSFDWANDKDNKTDDGDGDGDDADADDDGDSDDDDDDDAATNGEDPELSKRPDGLRLAKVKLNSEFTASSRTTVLYPTDGGNMHRFTAKTACAVLDVLGPPYCDPDGRHCQFYREFPFNVFPVKNVSVDDGEEYVWLKERDIPKDHRIVGVPYNGPKIVKK